jgi:hypothetical protein
MKMAQKKDSPTQDRSSRVHAHEQSRTGRGMQYEGGATGMYPQANEANEHENEQEREERDSVRQIVARYPYPSLLTSFGLGFGFGLVVTLLVNRREPNWFERNVSEPIHHFPDRLKRVPEAIGSHLPNSWKSW